MNKKFINGFLLASLIVGSAGTFTSCKDYDDDIDNLQQQVDAINIKLGDLTEKLKDGLLVKNVTSNADGGIAITLSDGNTYNIGANGAPGNSWTIGSDGYWYENGQKTNYLAIGQNGTNGTNGTNGENGCYYVPNVSTGNFDIYRDGKPVESTTISWRAQESSAGSTAVTSFYSGNTLTLANVDSGRKNEKGEPIYESVELTIGSPVGSIEFIPSVMSSNVAYPTTDSEFFFLTKYISDAKYNSANKDFIVQTDFNKSNVVALEYRLNPSDAYIYEFAPAEFINRSVTSRADGDATTLLNVVTKDVTVKDGNNERVEKSYFTAGNGEISINATVNGTKLSIGNKNDIVALQLKNGQKNWSTSDYVAIKGTEIDALLVDSATMIKNPTAGVKEFYNRTKAIVSAAAETSDFIQQFVTLSDAANAELVYTGELNLRELPGLYSNQKSEWLSKLGFTGMSYKFSLPKEYKSNDVQGTNQQWFVELNGTVLTVNRKNLTDGLTPAIDRTPVVRVDAFLTDNAGNETMVGSAYIKVKIVREPTTAPVDKNAYNYELGVKEYEYHALAATPTLINQMDWTMVNNKIYGVTGLTANTFWNYYGGANKSYEVKVTTTENTGAEKVIGTGTAQANNTFTITNDGISCETTLGSSDTQTSNIKFSVDNKVKTENTYKDFDGKGAQYVVTITIPSNNKAVRGDVVVKQTFYVREDCKEYTFNPNYYAGTVQGKENVVITKGKVVGGSWKLEMNISEVFQMINNRNIFSYFNTVNNATAINFALDPAGQPNVSYTQSSGNGTIALTAPLTTKELFAGMKYDVTLVNGEKCTFKFNILFRNPFVATKGAALSLNGNEIGKVEVDTKPSVLVNDVDGKAIYSWNASSRALVLSSLALNGYKLNASDVTVTYAFKNTQAYKDFTNNLDPASTFGINASTGVVTYENLGAVLIKSYDLEIEATVSFGNISKVTCSIPFSVKGQN